MAAYHLCVISVICRYDVALKFNRFRLQEGNTLSDSPANTLIQALHNPALFDHAVNEFQVIETHISQVLLTGDYAYKIKKPMNFGFLDFSTLAQRKHFCEEELRLNKRLAEPLYLKVIPVTGTPQNPVLGGSGEAFEYVLQMRQFRQQDLFDRLQERGKLEPHYLTTLARQAAQFHENLAPVDASSPLGAPDAVYAAMQENFDQIRPLLSDSAQLAQLDNLQSWARTTFERHQPLIAARHQQGLVRECHGDLHLANITLYNNQVTVFDCIEFNEPFRWIDVINDLAFLLMDLESRGERTKANLVLNTYLEYRDDFAALPLLPLYKAYRAMVRAKIALLTLGSPGLPAAEQTRLLARYKSYAQLAEDYSAIPTRLLLTTSGLSASGKTCVSAAMSAELGLIRLRSDVERKRLHGLGPLDSSGSATGADLYSDSATEDTYQRLAQLSETLLAQGYAVIVDAACLKRAERQRFANIAENQGVPFAILYCEASEEQRRIWIQNRRDDASEATEALLDEQMTWLEAIGEDEASYTIRLHTEQPDVAQAVAGRIRQHFGLALA